MPMPAPKLWSELVSPKKEQQESPAEPDFAWRLAVPSALISSQQSRPALLTLMVWVLHRRTACSRATQ